MRRLASLFIFFLVSISGFAQVQIIVSDKTSGETLPGVTLSVKGTTTDQAIAIADENGVINVTPEQYPVTYVVSFVGYVKYEIEVKEAGTYKVQLTTDANQLEQVVVTGQFEPQSVRNSVYQVRTISNERIMMRSPVNVQGALSTELGIRFSNDLTLGTADITLMGMSGRNVKILLDGVPLIDRGDTRESLNQIDINTIDRIEIVEGPMSVVYGTDALAGVINIITKKYTGDKLSIEARVHEETAGKEYEAFKGRGVHNESVNLNWSSKHFYAGGGITRNNFGGWDEGRSVYVSNPDGDGEWHPKDQWLTNTTVGFRNESFNIWYRLNYLNEKTMPLGNASAEGQVMFTDKQYITNRFTHQLQADWTFNDRWSFNGSGSLQDLTRRTMTTYYNSTTGEVTLSPEIGSQSKAAFYMGMVRGIFMYKMTPKISWQPGFEFNTSTGSGDRIDRERTISDYAAFVSAEYKPTSKINIRPGLRFIHNSAYEAPPVIPSLNTKFVLSNSLDLRLAYAYGFRAPALRELYFYFFDASHSIAGNPDLKSEYSNSFSGSLTWTVPQLGAVRLKSVLGGFYNQFDNLIALGVDPNNTTINTYINVLKFKTTGVTLENMIYWKDLSVTLGGSYIGSYNQLTEDDSSLPDLMWRAEVNAVASYTFKKIKNTISLYYKYTGKRQAYFVDIQPDPDEIKLGVTEDFSMLDISVSQALLKYLTLTVGVKNVLDVTQLLNTTQEGGAHVTNGNIPMSYGRSYFATLAFRWTK